MLATVSFATPARGALYMLRRGFRVFPCKPGAKVPALEHWQAVATADETAFRALAAQYPGHNWGALGDGVACVDVDAKTNPTTGKTGFDELLELPAVPRTLTVTTPRGGLHYWVRGALKSCKLASCIDLRAAGQYALCPGSVFEGKTYSIADEGDIAEAPAWIAEHRRAAPQERAETAATIVGALDTPERIAEAVRLALTLPPAIEGAGGDTSALQAAMRLRDAGVSHDTALEIMMQYYEPRCVHAEPAAVDFNAEWLEAKVRNAYAYAANPIGGRPPTLPAERLFDVLPAGIEPPPGFATPGVKGEPPAPEVAAARALARRLFAAPAAERWGDTQPQPLPHVVDKIVPQGAVTILGGAGGRGKTTLALQMAISIASGKPFFGLPVMQGETLGLFGEDPEALLHARVKRTCASLGEDFHAVGRSLFTQSLIDEDMTLWLCQRYGPGAETPFLAELQAACAARPGLRALILDGASLAFSGSEVDRAQVTAFLGRLQRFAAAVGIAIILLAHESKTSAKGDDVNILSGSTAWVNRVRSVLRLETDDDRKPDGLVLAHRKANYGPKADPIPLVFANGVLTKVDLMAEVDDTIARIAPHVFRFAAGAGNGASLVEVSNRAGINPGKIERAIGGGAVIDGCELRIELRGGRRPVPWIIWQK